MRVYRIFDERRSPNDPTGAKIFGGRWNPEGYGVLYVSTHLSLSCLETLVHLGQKSNPSRIRYGWTDIPEVSDSLDSQRLYVYQGEPVTAEIGKQWLVHGQALAVRVPSILVPEEDNVLLNPFHETYRGLAWDSKPFHWDRRFLDMIKG